MSVIHVSIVGEHRLLCEGIASILVQTTDIRILSQYSSIQEFFLHPSDLPIHVIIQNVHKISQQDIAEVEDLQKLMPKAKVLIISSSENEQTIFQVIRAGAKGFLAHDAERHDLIEAVYSLRNGFDYFSKCITTILLNRYISSLQNKNEQQAEGIEKLSSREIEILTLWGKSLTNQEIAEKLFISVRTVESHKTHIMQKLNLKTAVDLMKYAIKNNIIQLE